MTADEPLALSPPSARPHRNRRLVLGMTALAACAFGAGTATLLVHEDVAPVVHVASPVVQVAAPTAHVEPPAATVTPTAPVVDEPPRASAPHLDAACVEVEPPGEDAVERPASCAWDNGFPAISRDGSMLVALHVPDDGGRGNPGLTVRFVDVATSRVVRDLVVLDPEEVDTITDRTRRQQRVRARVARAQELVKGYRTLVPLGSHDTDAEAVTVERRVPYADFDRARVRAIDPATNTVLWQHDFTSDPPRRANDTELCGGWDLRALSVAWDPTTRVALATSDYQTGGCLCSFETVYAARRL